MNSVDELEDALRGEIGRCAGRAIEQAELLESAGARLLDLLGEAHSSDADELVRSSHGIRAQVVNALLVLAELQHVAGRLDALAALKAAMETPVLQR